MQLQPNITFDSHYTLIRQLGRGGFSEVWLAHDSYMDLDVALKIYAPQGMDANSIDEFRHEIKQVFELNHPNLLKPTYLGVWECMPYLILPYCANGSLTKHIGKMPETEMWQMIYDVATGLSYLHEQEIVHQDIKPDNILISEENKHYLISDFGMSTKAFTLLSKRSLGDIYKGGTIPYMPPERFSNKPTPVKASDIWSFGAMLYELVTGQLPFREFGGSLQKTGAEIPVISQSISNELASLIYQMLSVDTRNRPTASDISEMALKILTNQPLDVSTKPTSTTTYLTTPKPYPQRHSTDQTAPPKKRVQMVAIEKILLF